MTEEDKIKTKLNFYLEVEYKDGSIKKMSYEDFFDEVTKKADRFFEFCEKNPIKKEKAK